MIGIVWRNGHSNDVVCNTSGTEIGVALAPKGLDLFQPFLRGASLPSSAFFLR